MFIYFKSFFFNDTATTEIYTLSLHDALPISDADLDDVRTHTRAPASPFPRRACTCTRRRRLRRGSRSEEHTSELQSRQYLVCRLLLEKKNTKTIADLVNTDMYDRVSKRHNFS